MQTARKERATIVGVTSDFKFEGDRLQIEPTVYTYDPDDMGYVSMKIPGRNISDALGAIDRTWHAFIPTIAIRRYFLDSDFESEFQADQHQSTLFNLFVIIAISIACLGLFGLAAFSTERRTKEIGLRKTFGARTRDIVLMLLWQFSIPVLIAI